MNTLPHLRTWAFRLFAATALLIVAAHCDALAQTTITTKEGKEYRGSVVDERGDAVTLLTADSVRMIVPRSQIRTIVYADEVVAGGPAPATSDAAAPPSAPPPVAAPPIVEKSAFPVFGGTLGTPGGLNLVAGYYFNGWGVRLSGMYLSTINGLEFELLRNIGRNGLFSHNIHVGIGRSHVELESERYAGVYEVYDWRYMMAGYDFNWNSFYVSASLSAGSGDFSSPQLLFQLGYVKEFR